MLMKVSTPGSTLCSQQFTRIYLFAKKALSESKINAYKLRLNSVSAVFVPITDKNSVYIDKHYLCMTKLLSLREVE